MKIGTFLATWFIVIGTPLWLSTVAISLLMSPAWLAFEYQRGDFPRDAYGFSVDDRLTYAPIALAFIQQNYPVEWLAQAQLEGRLCYPPSTHECLLYTTREVQHLHDVQLVVRSVYLVGIVSALTCVGATALLAHARQLHHLLNAYVYTSVFMLAFVFTIIFIATVAWDFFFDVFHGLFFQEGTWRFLYSDTLIRLYPERFWFDSAVAIGVFLVLCSMTILGLTSYSRKRNHDPLQTDLP